MFNEILLNRVIFVGVTCYVLVVGVHLMRWHIRHEITAALAQAAPAMQQFENENEKQTAQEAGVHRDTHRIGGTETPIEDCTPQTMSEDTRALPKSKTQEHLNIAEAFLLHKTMEGNSW